MNTNAKDQDSLVRSSDTDRPLPSNETGELEIALAKMRQNIQKNSVLKVLSKLDELASDIACISDTSAEGRKAKMYGEKMHKIISKARIAVNANHDSTATNLTEKQ